MPDVIEFEGGCILEKYIEIRGGVDQLRRFLVYSAVDPEAGTQGRSRRGDENSELSQLESLDWVEARRLGAGN